MRKDIKRVVDNSFINNDIITYEEAREWARKNNITTVKQYINTWKLEPNKQRIPRLPNIAYQEFTNWADFLNLKTGQFFDEIPISISYRNRFTRKTSYGAR